MAFLASTAAPRQREAAAASRGDLRAAVAAPPPRATARTRSNPGAELLVMPSVLLTARDYLSARSPRKPLRLLSYTRAGFLETATTGAAATGPKGATTTTTRRTRRKVGPTPDQPPRRSHPAVDVSGPTAERAGRLSGLWRSAGRWRSAVGPSRARRRRLYRKRWARSRGRPAARATTPGSPSPAFLDNSRRLLSHSCASIYHDRRPSRPRRANFCEMSS